MKKEGKVNISITLDSQILKNLNDFCKKNYSVRSKLIEHAIKDFLEKRGNS